MQEVLITIRFNRACLGAAKKRRHGQVVFSFDKDAAGRVMFMPAAWAAAMTYAAKLSNRHQSSVRKIDWCPVISGAPRNDWRRTIVGNDNKNKIHYAVHEAFQPGDDVIISAVLPPEIPVSDFEKLLTIIGKYRGFSPFNNKSDKYGTFEVISVEPTGLGVVES